MTGNLEAAVELTPVKMTFRPFAENRHNSPHTPATEESLWTFSRCFHLPKEN